MAKLAQTASVTLMSGLIAFFFIGCSVEQKPQEKPPSDAQSDGPSSSSQKQDVKFDITEPQSGTEVDRNIITVRGVGASPGDSLKVEVLTNEWYLQDGSFDIGDDGTWTFAPCNLKGRGNFRLHHAIKVSLLKGNEVIAFDTVDEITAPEPIQ
ncbi:MAG TPA: hypothetical protein VF179_03480 [Thermoanaerobaculia bacterium]|nr:hypothetical protein [Thermoanaerobaculia bacterium]